MSHVHPSRSNLIDTTSSSTERDVFGRDKRQGHQEPLEPLERFEDRPRRREPGNQQQLDTQLNYSDHRRKQREDKQINFWPPSPPRAAAAAAVIQSQDKSKEKKKRRHRGDSSSDDDSESDLDSDLDSVGRSKKSSKKKKSSSSRKSSSSAKKSKSSKSKKTSKSKSKKSKKRSRRDDSDSSDNSSDNDSASDAEGAKRSDLRDASTRGAPSAEELDKKEAQEFWQEKTVYTNDDGIEGPLPLPEQDMKLDKRAYGGALLAGEGSALAAYVQSGKRIPRRGEIGLEPEEIQAYEGVGFVMSGSRHRRMNAVRIRKENQVISAEEKNALLMFAQQEKLRKETETIVLLKEMVASKIKPAD